MRYNVGSITDQGDIGLVNAPEIGAESRVSVSYDAWKEVGALAQPAPDSGTFTAKSGFTFPDAGLDLQLVADRAVLSTDALTVTLDVTFNDDSAGQVKATFDQQSYFKDQSENFGQFAAVDLVPQGGGNADKKVKAITGVNAVTGGRNGNSFEVVSLPEQASYVTIPCKMECNLEPPFTKSNPIACGFDGSAFTKRARSEPGNLRLTAKHFSVGDGLTRLGGHRVTVLIEVYKDDMVLDQRAVVSDWRPTPMSPRGDGDDEVVSEAEGVFANCALFSV